MNLLRARDPAAQPGLRHRSRRRPGTQPGMQALQNEQIIAMQGEPTKIVQQLSETIKPTKIVNSLVCKRHSGALHARSVRARARTCVSCCVV